MGIGSKLKQAKQMSLLMQQKESAPPSIVSVYAQPKKVIQEPYHPSTMLLLEQKPRASICVVIDAAVADAGEEVHEKKAAAVAAELSLAKEAQLQLPAHITLPNLFHSHMRRLEAQRLQREHPEIARTRIVFANFSPYESSKPRPPTAATTSRSFASPALAVGTPPSNAAIHTGSELGTNSTHSSSTIVKSTTFGGGKGGKRKGTTNSSPTPYSTNSITVAKSGKQEMSITVSELTAVAVTVPRIDVPDESLQQVLATPTATTGLRPANYRAAFSRQGSVINRPKSGLFEKFASLQTAKNAFLKGRPDSSSRNSTIGSPSLNNTTASNSLVVGSASNGSDGGAAALSPATIVYSISTSTSLISPDRYSLNKNRDKTQQSHKASLTSTVARHDQLEECGKILEAFNKKGIPISKHVVEHGILRPEELLHKSYKNNKKLKNKGSIYAYIGGNSVNTERTSSPTSQQQQLSALLASAAMSTPIRELAELSRALELREKKKAAAAAAAVAAANNATTASAPTLSPAGMTTTVSFSEDVEKLDDQEDGADVENCLDSSAEPSKPNTADIPDQLASIVREQEEAAARIYRPHHRNRKSRRNAAGIIGFQSIVVRPAGFEDDTDVRFDHRNRGTKTNSWWSATEYKTLKRSMLSRIKSVAEEKRARLIRIAARRKKLEDETPLDKRVTRRKPEVLSSLDALPIDPTDTREYAEHVHGFIKKNAAGKGWFPSVMGSSSITRPESASVPLFDSSPFNNSSKTSGSKASTAALRKLAVQESAADSTLSRRPLTADNFALPSLSSTFKNVLSTGTRRQRTMTNASAGAILESKPFNHNQRLMTDPSMKIYSSVLNQELAKIENKNKRFFAGDVYHDQSFRMY